MKATTDIRDRTKLFALVPLAHACLACAVPWLIVHSSDIGFALQRGFALVCHQQPERSFAVFGGSVAVCARCLGIYLGAAVGLLVRVSRNVARRLLIVAASVSGADWFAESAGWHGNWMVVRFVLGLILGATAAMLVIASANEVKIPAQVKAA